MQLIMSKIEKIDNNIGFYIGFTANVLKNEVIRRFHENGYEITHSQWLILMMLWQKDGRNQNELTGLMYREKTTITRVIEIMEKRGLIFRKTDTNDRRNKLCFLTNEGNDLKNKLIPIVREVNNQAISEINTDEFEIFKNIIKKVLTNLNYDNTKLENC